MGGTFNIGDVITDSYTTGVFYSYTDSGKLYMLVRAGNTFNTLEAYPERWVKIDHIDGFEAVLEKL